MSVRCLFGSVLSILLFPCTPVCGGGGGSTIHGWDNTSGDDLWGTAANWTTDEVPGFIDPFVERILLAGTSVAGPQTIDLGGITRQINRIEADGVDTTVGSYTFENGTIEIMLTGGNSLLSDLGGGSLQFDTNILLNNPNGLSRFNVQATGNQIVVNGDVAPSAATGTTDLVLTSRSTSLSPSVTVTGDISDGTAGAALALTAGFGPDSANHRGVVRVTGNNSYTGQTIVNGATLEFDSIANADGTSSALGAPDETAIPGSGTIRLGSADSNQPSVPGTLRYIGTGDTTDRVIELASAGSGGVIESNSTGTPLVFTAPSFTVGAGAKTLTLGGANTGDNEIQSILPDAPLGVQAVGVGGGGGTQGLTLEKAGGGTWVLSGANTYAGGTVISDGRLIVNTTSLPVAGGVVNNSELEFDITTTQSVYSGDISGSGDLIKSGNFSNLTLSGANTYTGDTIITGGSITTGSIANVGGVSGIGAGSTVRLDDGFLVYTGPTASTDRNFVLEPGATDPGVSSFSGELTISGIVSGEVASEFKLTGSIQLTGANTYAGDTRVQGGTLRVNNTSGSGTGTGDVSVDPTGSFFTATLLGIGAISGAVTVENGGTLLPGELTSSVGILTVGDITFNNGSTFAVELVGDGGVDGIDYDQLAVSNTTTINGGTLDVILLEFNPTLGNQFEILSFGGSISGAGFDTLDLPMLDPGLVWNTSNLLSTGILAVVPGLLGDYNADGIVNAADYTAWRDTLGQSGTGLAADGDNSGTIDIADYNLWKNNFGMTAAALQAASSPTAAVPEPATMWLFLVAIGAFFLLPACRIRILFPSDEQEPLRWRAD